MDKVGPTGMFYMGRAVFEKTKVGDFFKQTKSDP